jgi:hypothetical protein
MDEGVLIVISFHKTAFRSLTVGAKRLNSADGTKRSFFDDPLE